MGFTPSQILKQNPHLKFGGMKIQYVTFELAKEKTKEGFPINLFDEKGQPVVNNVIYYELPYLDHEVKLIFNNKREQEVYGSTF